MISTIFFDLGNTIIDYHQGEISDDEKDIIGLWNMVVFLRNKNIQVSFDSLYNDFYQPWLDIQPLRKKQKTEYDLEPFLSKVINLEKLTAGIYQELILQFYEPCSRFAVSSSELIEILEKLQKKYTIGLISNTPVPGFCHDQTLRNLDYLNYFKIRLYSFEFGIRKPDPEIFDKALSLANCRPDQALMIGDSIELDIKTPSQLGMKVIHYCGIKNNDSNGSNYTKIYNWKDLITIIDQIN
jgi:HAD superfamily hydrolase (TIGR01549 family)